MISRFIRFSYIFFLGNYWNHLHVLYGDRFLQGHYAQHGQHFFQEPSYHIQELPNGIYQFISNNELNNVFYDSTLRIFYHGEHPNIVDQHIQTLPEDMFDEIANELHFQQ